MCDRENIMWELYDTEKGYVQDLHIIVDCFMNPLRESHLITPEEINKIFSTVEMLLPLHQDLLEQLCKSPSISVLLQRHLGNQDAIPDPNFTVGHCFITMSQYLKMYSQYCSNQEVANSTLNQLFKTNKPFEEKVYELSQRPECRRLDLHAYLIKPMQRVCKYPLLLREALGQTPEDHEDYPHLQKAFGLISATVGSINESKRIMEESETLLEIQHRMTYPKKYPPEEYPIIAPGRKFQEKGQCNFVSRSFSTSTVKWYLFNDLFVLTTTRFQLKKYVLLNSALLGHVKVEGFDFAFEIIHAGQDKIWLAWKKEARCEHLRSLLREKGMIDRADEVHVNMLQEYSSRPIPIPPGKFQGGGMPMNFDQIVARVESLSALPPIPAPDQMPRKASQSFVISGPSGFRRVE